MAVFKADSRFPPGSYPRVAFFAITFSFLLCLAACQPGSPDPAAGLLDSIPSAPADTPPLRIGTSGDYAPFSTWDEGATEPSGFSVDVARAWAGDRGRTIEWVRFRWPALLSDLALGRFDLALSGITLRPERSAAGLFSTPLARSGAVLLVPVESPHRTLATLDRAGVRIAVNEGGHLERVTRRLLPRAKIEAISNNAAVPVRLVQGQVDAVMTDDIEAPHWLRNHPGLRAIGPWTHDRKGALFSLDQTPLEHDFDRWLIDAERRGELASLRERHGLPDERTATPTLALVARVDERLSLMPAVADAKRSLGLAIEDRPREGRVLESAWLGVERAARENGVSPPPREPIEALFRAQIEAAKAIQRRRMETAREQAPLDPVQARKLLDTELRPALLRLGERITDLLVRIHAESARRGGGGAEFSFDTASARSAISRHAPASDPSTVWVESLLEALSAALPQPKAGARTETTEPLSGASIPNATESGPGAGLSPARPGVSQPRPRPAAAGRFPSA